ncbi:MAG: bifunctional demethylmenaquinone methyltransferase/2-methoxy-6-polyprenyl-1,4-benzoquinol methylase UbiE [Bacteroidaceae bacterium]|nr:bifunctional demethylmenaquinone methyltransferase/2-methoxy-6-polyprenyl-1,4-benzoquinol methylase UbiE [Bacteroidaceae bacterium]
MDYPQENIKPYSKDGSKGEQVKQMFDHIAPTYDRLNHTLSFGIDRYWRKKAINWLRPFHPKHIMDVATGTGDFAILAYRKLQPEELIGTDISEGMMNIGQIKVKKEKLSDKISFGHEDCCTRLSYADKKFDAITVAFGIRNFENLDKGLSEMYRVLTPGGHLVILELTTPERFPIKQLFHFYSNIFIPLLGKRLSADSKAYHYLPQSIEAFPQGEIMKGIIEKAGFNDVRFKKLTFGICTLYTATKENN